MSEIKHINIDEIPSSYKAAHEDYKFYKRPFVKRGEAKNTQVNVYELLPGMSAYPYHYHLENEECFYIISGEGILKTPEGEKKVTAGDLLFFPCGKNGAHKLTNSSDAENLVYIDFDVIYDVNVAVYPDSEKVGIWSDDVKRILPLNSELNYFDGE